MKEEKIKLSKLKIKMTIINKNPKQKKQVRKLVEEEKKK
jgi:hypothetical protein